MRSDVQVFDREGTYLQTIGGFGQGEGQLNFPAAIARDSAGNIWVADTGHDTMQQFSANGMFQAAWGKSGYGPGDFINITDVAIDGQDRLFVLDGGAERVKVFTPDGTFLGGWGGAGNDAGCVPHPVGHCPGWRGQRLRQRLRERTSSEIQAPAAAGRVTRRDEDSETARRRASMQFRGKSEHAVDSLMQ